MTTCDRLIAIRRFAFASSLSNALPGYKSSQASPKPSAKKCRESGDFPAPGKAQQVAVFRQQRAVVGRSHGGDQVRYRCGCVVCDFKGVSGD